MADKTENVVATNRKAFFDYAILDRFEAGIELKGTEVKSLRTSKASLSDSYARVENGEVFLYNMHISPYEFGNMFNADPVRPRKLLLHKNQIKRLAQETLIKKLTIIPLKVYFKNNRIKVEIALAKGKKHYDKRESIKKREVGRELKKILRNKN